MVGKMKATVLRTAITSSTALLIIGIALSVISAYSGFSVLGLLANQFFLASFKRAGFVELGVLLYASLPSIISAKPLEQFLPFPW